MLPTEKDHTIMYGLLVTDLRLLVASEDDFFSLRDMLEQLSKPGLGLECVTVAISLQSTSSTTRLGAC
jgi:hypothetical protein